MELFSLLTYPLSPLPLWSEHWDGAALRAKAAELGSRAFDRGFRQVAYIEGERTFPSFAHCLSYGIAPRHLVEKGWRYVCGVDFSAAGRAGTVVVTLGVSLENLRVPVDIQILSDPAALPGVLLALYHRYRPQVIMLEDNALQGAVIDMVRTATRGQCRLPLQGFTTGRQKADPAIGLPSLEVEFANGMWRIPLLHEIGPADSDTDPWVRLVREFQGHPFHSSDDLVMATWFAREAIWAKRALVFDEHVSFDALPNGQIVPLDDAHDPDVEAGRPRRNGPAYNPRTDGPGEGDGGNPSIF
jgi:hypothetical protein